MQSEMNFYKFDRAEWSQFHSQNFTSVTDAELAQLRSLNDEISLDDVKTIYSPLRHLIHIRYEDYQGDMFTLSRFLGMQRNPHTHRLSSALPVRWQSGKAPPRDCCNCC